MRPLSRARRSSPPRILLVEDRPQIVDRLLAALPEAMRASVVWVADEEAFSAALDRGVDLVVAGEPSAGVSGWRVLEIAASRSRAVPVLLVLPAEREDRLVEAVRRGAADVLFEDRLPRLAPAILRTLESERRRRASGRAAEEIERLGGVLAAIRATRRLVLAGETLDRVIGEACRLVVEQGGFRMAWIGIPEPSGVLRPAVRAGLDVDYLDEVEVRWDDLPAGCGPSGRAVRERRTVVVHDIGRDPIFAPWKREALARGFRSSVAVPVIDGEAVVAMLGVYGEWAGSFGEDARHRLEEIALVMSLAFHLLAVRPDPRSRGASRAAALEALLTLASGLASEADRPGLVGRGMAQLGAAVGASAVRFVGVGGGPVVAWPPGPEGAATFGPASLPLVVDGGLGRLEIDHPTADPGMVDVITAFATLAGVAVGEGANGRRPRAAP